MKSVTKKFTRLFTRKPKVDYWAEGINSYTQALRDNPELAKQVKSIEVGPDYYIPVDLDSAAEFGKLLEQKQLEQKQIRSCKEIPPQEANSEKWIIWVEDEVLTPEQTACLQRVYSGSKILLPWGIESFMKSHFDPKSDTLINPFDVRNTDFQTDFFKATKRPAVITPVEVNAIYAQITGFLVSRKFRVEVSKDYRDHDMLTGIDIEDGSVNWEFSYDVEEGGIVYTLTLANQIMDFYHHTPPSPEYKAGSDQIIDVLKAVMFLQKR
jgi:hypothetical protein